MPQDAQDQDQEQDTQEIEEQVRQRLSGRSHVFEDPRSYMDGVRDAVQALAPLIRPRT